MNVVNGNYHALLARHDAMRLRRQLLQPGQRTEGDQTEYDGEAAYDGAADQELISRYLELVTPFDDLITDLYDVMFTQWPYLRSLFPESMDFQRRHLGQIFWYLIENLHNPDEVAQVFTRLGRDHRKLGVRPAHYEAFEASLCAALRRSAGPHWNEAMEAAWVRMLRFAVAAMVRGAEAAIGEPADWPATVTAHEIRRPGLAVLRVRTHEPYPYRAGQYASVESPLLPQAWRQYSLARAPRPDGELEFHVRQVGVGGVSEALVSHTRPGDVLRLGPAGGTMTLDDPLPRDLLLVAADTGWATVKALLEELSTRRSVGRSVHLFLGIDDASGSYDSESPAVLERRFGWLRVTPVNDRAPGGAAYGRLAETVVGYRDWSEHQAYVSGPPAMVGALVRQLGTARLPADRIRHDPLPHTPALTTRHVPALDGPRRGELPGAAEPLRHPGERERFGGHGAAVSGEPVRYGERGRGR
ncbi:globin domain-containing protein [Streptomyces sp. NPDC003077]|uniref:globin domain-containing protein n=1 Tax=Streptomyces sp. NPDC003077 TaxID=3154443 RepID=UPI0033A07A75